MGLLPGQRDQGRDRGGVADLLAAVGSEPPAEYAEKQKRYLEEQKEIDKKAREKEKSGTRSREEADELLHHHHGFANTVALSSRWRSHWRGGGVDEELARLGRVATAAGTAATVLFMTLAR